MESSKLIEGAGGGYILPMSPAHLDWMDHTKTKASEAGVEIDICVLEYCMFSPLKFGYHNLDYPER